MNNHPLEQLLAANGPGPGSSGLPLDLLQEARESIARILSGALNLDEQQTMILGSMKRPQGKGFGGGDLILRVGGIAKQKQWNVPNGEAVKKMMNTLEQLLAPSSASGLAEYVESAEPTPDGTHIAITLPLSYTGRVLVAITQQDYLAKLSPAQPQQERIMIEYSQPNTHKAFHVGHMRNVALGDCLVRLNEQCGNHVIAANYYGDEGAHVAKCLWRLQQFGLAMMDNERGESLPSLSNNNNNENNNENDQTAPASLAHVPVAERGEFLGKMYAEAVELLDLSSLTLYPCPGAIVARVLTKDPHPNNQHKHWNVCRLDIGGNQTVSVVCGGTDYAVGDAVAYMPIGEVYKKKTVVPVDMGGVESSGVMLSYQEARAPDPNAPDDAADRAKKKKNKKCSERICLIQGDDVQPGAPLTEAGRLDDITEPADETVDAILARRQHEVDLVLKALESGDPNWCELWEMTKQWSLDEFQSIYEWLEARFDVNFFESLVSGPSMKLAQEWTDRGQVFEYHDGAIKVNLDEYKLGSLTVVKSNGSGLYATKDLALARQKFQDFSIDRSIYVVDKGQTLHFKQVFATLDRMGFAGIRDKSFHLAYGQVVRPEGKMSSRDGTVIYFSALRKALSDAINKEYLNQYVGSWTAEHRLEANRAIAAGTIRYGMLNVDPDKDITFKLEAWIAKKGNTGPYLMYAYARICSILSKAGYDPAPDNERGIDLSLLGTPQDRCLVTHLSQFHLAVIKATSTCKPSVLCKYLYVLAQAFMPWYETSHVLQAESEALKQARLVLVDAVGRVLEKGLGLLGMTALDRM